MAKKFGEFKTVMELNKAAAEQKEKGDLNALVELALENGIEAGDAQDYFEDFFEELCTARTAAFGKLELEKKELKLESQLKDWADYVGALAAGYKDDTLAEAIFNPEKKLLNVLAKGIEMASKHRVKVDAAIVKAAGIGTSAVYIGMCGKDELKKIIFDYYLGDKNESV